MRSFQASCLKSSKRLRILLAAERSGGLPIGLAVAVCEHRHSVRDAAKLLAVCRHAGSEPRLFAIKSDLRVTLPREAQHVCGVFEPLEFFCNVVCRALEGFRRRPEFGRNNLESIHARPYLYPIELESAPGSGNARTASSRI